MPKHPKEIAAIISAITLEMEDFVISPIIPIMRDIRSAIPPIKIKKNVNKSAIIRWLDGLIKDVRYALV